MAFNTFGSPNESAPKPKIFFSNESFDYNRRLNRCPTMKRTFRNLQAARQPDNSVHSARLTDSVTVRHRPATGLIRQFHRLLFEHAPRPVPVQIGLLMDRLLEIHNWLAADRHRQARFQCWSSHLFETIKMVPRVLGWKVVLLF